MSRAFLLQPNININQNQIVEWGDITGTLSNQTDLQNALNAKADLNSPSFTGTPTAPTPLSGDNSTKIATTAFVNNITNIVGLVYVDELADLPTPIGGVITLAAYTAYYFTTTIDLLGSRLVLSDATVLLGTSSETAILKSTGLIATPFITASHGGPNPIQNIAIHDIDIVFDIDGLGGSNAALDWVALNLVSCGSVGTIKNIT